jgi:hypothetical protein
MDGQGKVEASYRSAGIELSIPLIAGKHRLSVEKTGFHPFLTEIAVEPGGRREIDVKLKQDTAKPADTQGSVELEVSDVGVTVQILDEQGKVVFERRADTRTLTIPVGSGKRRLLVLKDGNPAFSKELMVRAGAIERIRAVWGPAAAPANAKKDVKDSLPIGQWVDVLPWVDLKEDCLTKPQGPGDEWKLVGNSLRAPAGAPPLLTAPITIQGDYDLKIEYTWLTQPSIGDERLFFIRIYLPLGSRLYYPFGVCAANFGRMHNMSSYGVAVWDQKFPPQEVFVAREDFMASSATWAASVRRREAGSYSIQVRFNGRPILERSIDSATLDTISARDLRTMMINKRTGISVSPANVAVDLHSIKVKLVSGTASFHRAW